MLAAVKRELASLGADRSAGTKAIQQQLAKEFRGVDFVLLTDPQDAQPLFAVIDNRQPKTQIEIAWLQERDWQVKALPAWPSDVFGLDLDSWAISRTSGTEVLLVYSNLGDGHARTMELVRLEQGDWHRVWLGPVWANADVTLSGVKGFTVSTWDSGVKPDPFQEQMGCLPCPHTYRMDVWARSGDQFAKRTSEMQKSPYYTLKRFLAAQAAGQTDQASALAVNKQVYQQVLAAGLKVVPNLEANIPVGGLEPITLNPLGLQVTFVKSGDDWLINGVSRSQ